MREGALPIVAFVAVAASKAAAAGLHAIWPEGGALSVDAVLTISVSLLKRTLSPLALLETGPLPAESLQ